RKEKAARFERRKLSWETEAVAVVSYRLRFALPARGQIAFDVEAAGQSHPVDLQIFHNALDIVARLREGDALDPVHNLLHRLAARVAIARDPVLGPARTRIVADEGEDVGAAEAVELFGEIGHAECRVVACVRSQAGGRPVKPALLRDGPGRRRHELEQAA